jgi:hypothetical protein
MAVRFGADAFAGAEGGHARRVGQTDLVALLVEKACHRISVGAGGFQAGRHAREALTLEPTLQLGQAVWASGNVLERPWC